METPLFDGKAGDREGDLRVLQVSKPSPGSLGWLNEVSRTDGDVLAPDTLDTEQRDGEFGLTRLGGWLRGLDG